MDRVRYELDPHNRLVINEAGKKSTLSKFRKVLDGRFKIDKNNNLSYHIKAPLDKSENIPHQVKIKGEWSLTDNHDLRLTLDKKSRETLGDEITLQGNILDTKANSLLFAVTTRTKENKRSTYVLNIGGSWKADDNNRLSFHAKKEKGEHDILTFRGAWEINKNHQIIYQYEKAHLILKRSKTHELIFNGYWDIKDKVRISYVLSKDTDSVFYFKTSAGIFKENYIKYQVGIALTDKAKLEERTITLFGKWKIKKNVGLLFEVKYKNNVVHAIVFGAEARITDRGTVLFKLKNDVENRDIGISVELSHKILKGDVEAFVRALKSSRESAIYAGAAWRW